ncbi:hypothetical protein SAMN02745866_00079 [Alteromonadaceae bacterium Bs31]|nr:hypothetical protein SAMN02745866_00079 [Alteromonadaceae bacterium Bs31]
MKLSPDETRVLGVLIEKAITTPDQYPLSINGLTTGCNQKTNREPVTNFSEVEVQDLVDSLTKKNLVSEVRVGSRVAKYQHRFYGSDFSAFKFNTREASVICTLFLRGPQTAGELRTRTNRLCEFEDVQHTEATLQSLVEYSGGPYVVKLEREPGRRENRYAHLFCGEAEGLDVADTEAAAPAPSSISSSSPEGEAASEQLEERIALLELIVEDLQAQINALKIQGTQE